jgi:ribosomal protein S27E
MQRTSSAPMPMPQIQVTRRPTIDRRATRGQGWPCRTCTFENALTVTICGMCGKTREQPLPQTKPCLTCTFVNPLTAVKCGVCQTALMQQPALR